MIDPTAPDFVSTPVSPERPYFNYAPADMCAPPYVTIITPFHNTGPVFHETARSVLQQSFQQWEWLIINDGSTDQDSLALLADYRHKDPRIRVIDHPENRGLSAARNTGFREACTDYVVQLDSDDLLEPTAVEKWCWFLTSHPEFAFCKGYSVGFEGMRYLWEGGFHEGEIFLEENRVDSTSMVRRAAQRAVGGYDEANRDGFEDWDFWLRCADAGFWGATVPEFLDWYRRRPSHSDRWANWDDGDRQQAFRAHLRQRYPHLWTGGFPQIHPRPHLPCDTLPDALPCDNRLHKTKPRLLMLLPWLTMGGADKFNLDLLRQLTARGWEVSIATTLPGDHPWLPLFARATPDLFILEHFLRLVDYPRFLRYLIHSRQVDAVLTTHSELGYLLLPYLRAHCPEVTFVDYCHLEEEWKNGMYPRLAVEYQELLDLNIASSAHLKHWMAERGADPQRIQVSYTNVDPEEWCPDPERRATLRQSLGLDETTPVILFAGRICDQKQPRVLAHTMLHLQRSGLPFTALVAGDGPDLGWLRAFVKDHELSDQVRLLGAMSNHRINELLTAADVFFLPSRWEGIALAIYEAMASGVAVVGADVGGQRELVTPECGVLIARGDEETEAQRYTEVLADLLRDPGRRAAMGRASRARVSAHFRLDRMGEEMLALFEYASRLRIVEPRPRPGVGLGRACAAQAIEHCRLSREAERKIQERDAWIGELGTAKAWLEGERNNWQRLAEERQTWIDELKRAKAWWEEHSANWSQIASERESAINSLRQSLWVRLGSRLGFLTPPRGSGQPK